LIPIYIMCDINDISVVPMVRAPFSKIPTIYVYDKYQGGIGLSKKLFSFDRLVLKAVYDHLKRCSCSNGCPSCSGPAMEAGEHGKASAVRILELIDLDV
jgi:DEAD/DEAH box helicase domain-containing protein